MNKHREAFCHMRYMGVGKPGLVDIKIWNSRDGVTPFITVCKPYGIEIRHVDFQGDKYDPHYKPKKGDLIWRDLKDEEAVTMAGKQYESLVEALAPLKNMSDAEIMALHGYDARAQIQSFIDAGKEEWIKVCLANKQPGEPHLELVTEDWK